MGPLLAPLAETSPTSVQGLATLIVVGAGSLGVLGVIAMLIVRGFWAKTGEPIVHALLVEELSKPERSEAIKKLVKDVIENELKRVDGLIRLEITSQVGTAEKGLYVAIAKFSQDVQAETAELKSLVTDKSSEDGEYRSNVLGRLAKIEGAFNVLTRGRLSSGSDNAFPSQGPAPGQRGTVVGPSYSIRDPEGTGRHKPLK